MTAGSRKAEIVISRLAPMPPKALAESTPARTRKTEPSIQRPATTTRCDNGAAACPRETRGSTKAVSSDEASTTTGASRNTQEVLEERTACLRASVASVQYRQQHRRAGPSLQQGLEASHQAGGQRRDRDDERAGGERQQDLVHSATHKVRSRAVRIRAM